MWREVCQIEPAERLKHVSTIYCHWQMPFAYLKSKKAVLPQNPPLEKRSAIVWTRKHSRLSDGWLCADDKYAAERVSDHLQSEETTGSRSIQSAEQKQVRSPTALPRRRRQISWNPMNISVTFRRASKTWRIRRAVLCRRAAPWSETLPKCCYQKKETDQVYLYLPSIKGGIIFSQVLAMEHYESNVIL